MRELRRVPQGWQHPKEAGKHIPLRGNYSEAAREWEKGRRAWEKGQCISASGGWKDIPPQFQHLSYEEWAGEAPNPDEFMPDWDWDEAPFLQVYETTTEGTPISPVMETVEQLAIWLAEHHASFFGESTLSAEHWLKVLKEEASPSPVFYG